MNKLSLFQVDAFADKLFSGNPAAVCPLDEWLPYETMQQIAIENNLSETAFFIPKENHFELRWFTPASEVELCGHATLATAHVLFNHLGYDKNEIIFKTRFSGDLMITRENDFIIMNFPVDDIKETDIPASLIPALGGAIPDDLYKGKTDYLLIFENEEEIKNIKPDFRILKELDARGVIVSAPGNEVDFVSRFFAPREAIDEDPVTGSAHTSLAPYWADKLNNKENLIARQISKRGGDLICSIKDDRVFIKGKAITYLEGTISL